MGINLLRQLSKILENHILYFPFFSNPHWKIGGSRTARSPWPSRFSTNLQEGKICCKSSYNVVVSRSGTPNTPEWSPLNNKDDHICTTPVSHPLGELWFFENQYDQKNEGVVPPGNITQVAQCTTPGWIPQFRRNTMVVEPSLYVPVFLSYIYQTKVLTVCHFPK